jgi:HAD superfamily hydrolase (TIGR01549 family)
MVHCKYRAIIFDFDGVLVESVDIKNQAYAELYKEYGPEVVDKVILYDVLHGGLSRFQKFRYYHQEILKKELSQLEEIRLGEWFSLLVEQAVVDAPWVPGVLEFLDTYAGVMDFYIASGTPEEELRPITKAREIAHYFKGVYGSPQTKAEIISKILSRSGLLAEEVVMVGDSITDYESAATAGVAFVGRLVNAQESFLPASIIKIKDFTDQTGLLRALFL